MTNNHVLVTGASGLIGSLIKPKLSKYDRIVGLDKNNSNYPINYINDLSSVDDIVDIIIENQVRTVIHLAADAAVSASWKSILKNNLQTTRNIFESSKIAGVTKIIYASSNHAVGLFENDQPYKSIIAGHYYKIKHGSFDLINDHCDIRPDSNYGVSKAFGESLGRYYHEEFGIKVACLRIGTVNKHNSPISNNSQRTFTTWCSYEDIINLIIACIDSDKITFNIFYGVSNNTWKIWDISNQEKILNFMNSKIYN